MRQGTDKLNIAIDHASDAKSQSEQAVTTADEAKVIAETATDNADASALVAIAAGKVADEAALNANTEAGNLDGLKTEVIEATELARNFDFTKAYDVSTKYQKNNSVSYNGSTFIALKESTGELPVEGEFWAVMAQRGLDGSGSMVSVNGKMPDSNGNVEIDAAELGAEIPTGAQAKATKAFNDAKAYTDSETVEMASNIELQTHVSKIASPTVLGHVKVGQNLTIDADGKLNASSGVVPDASTTLKGIVKLNDTLTATSKVEAATANTIKILNDKIKTLETTMGGAPVWTKITTLKGLWETNDSDHLRYWKSPIGQVFVRGTVYHIGDISDLETSQIADMPAGADMFVPPGGPPASDLLLAFLFGSKKMVSATVESFPTAMSIPTLLTLDVNRGDYNRNTGVSIMGSYWVN